MPPRPSSRAIAKSGRKPPGRLPPPRAAAPRRSRPARRAAPAKPLSWQKRWKTSSGIEPEIARIGAHVAGDEARVGEDLGLGVLDRGDVGRLDPEVALDVEQGLAERRPLAPQLVAEDILVGAKNASPPRCARLCS